MRETINIAIADDHVLVRAGFVALLKKHYFFNVLFEASNGSELLEALKKHSPEIILLDIAMPVIDGLQVMPTIRAQFPEISIIVVSAHSEPGSIIEYVNQGAASFLPKDCDIDVLVKAICNVSKNGRYFEDSVSGMLARAGAVPKAMYKVRKLTENETTVLEYFNQGLTIPEIAKTLELNEETVKTYRRVLLIKTHCEDIPSLLQYAKANGLVKSGI